jgi:hypothetical protein
MIYNLLHFVRNSSKITNIFTLGHFEMYLLKVLGAMYAPSHPD